MAIQIIQQPGSISFAGDPIIVKVKTTLTGQTFIRIKLVCEAKAYRNSEEHPYTETFSFEVASDGNATFNISGTVQNALNRCIVQDVENGKVVQTMYAAKFKLTYTEVFLDGMIEVEQGRIVSQEYKAIPGRLTDYERITVQYADTSRLLGNGRILSRKPGGELIPKGIGFYMPAVSALYDTLDYNVQQGSDKTEFSVFSGGVLVPVSVQVPTSNLELGNVVVSTRAEEGRKAYIVNQHPDMRHFLFINGFGMLESITAVTRESIQYEIESEIYSVVQDINFRSHTQFEKYASHPVATYSMSSGFVNMEWAEWWLNEFLPTRKAWMLHEGRYIPVVVIPDETNKVYDRSKPGLMAVNFKVRHSFTGGTHNSFVNI